LQGNHQVSFDETEWQQYLFEAMDRARPLWYAHEFRNTEGYIYSQIWLYVYPNICLFNVMKQFSPVINHT
jgi:hypothetical protein